jgi:hypothetical protein
MPTRGNLLCSKSEAAGGIARAGAMGAAHRDRRSGGAQDPRWHAAPMGARPYHGIDEAKQGLLGKKWDALGSEKTTLMRDLPALDISRPRQLPGAEIAGVARGIALRKCGTHHELDLVEQHYRQDDKANVAGK